MRIPLYMARDSERSLKLLLHDCDADPACHKRFPELEDKLTWLLASLDVNPRHVHVTHPRTGADLDLTITRAAITNILFAALYSPQTAALIPLLVDRADKEDYQGFLALAAGDELAELVAQGLQFSVLCSEDAPRVEPGSIEHEAADTFLGPETAEWRMRVCGFWPRGQVDAAYYGDLESSVPALILSGELDPVTPPSWGARVAAHWKNSRHVIVPGAGHGAAGSGCVMKLMREFLNRGSAAGLDVDCVQRVRRPPFFLGPSGPDPGGKPEGPK